MTKIVAPEASTPHTETGLTQYGEGANRAFAHLEELAGQVDLSGIEDPKQQWVKTLRYFMQRYGDVGDVPTLTGVTFEENTANGVPGLLVRTDQTDARKRILYIHGGGWAGGSPEPYKGIAAILAKMSGALIFVPDYRLAPENPYPAGLKDCIAAYTWLTTCDADTPVERMCVIGDSAGGNLSAATTLALIEDGGRIPDRLVLIAGTLDNTERSERVRVDDPICSAVAFSMCNQAYVTNQDMLEHPLVSPVYASRRALRQFPPTLLQVSGAESLIYDSEKFSKRLIEAKRRVILSVWPGMPHVWHSFLGILPEAKEALAEISEFVSS